MKNLLLIFSFFLISIGLRAQGNLQFNQVLTYSGEFPLSNLVQSQVSQTYTVPNGKVWKIEYFTIGGVQAGDYFQRPVIKGRPFQNGEQSVPIWLSKGDTFYYENYYYYTALTAYGSAIYKPNRSWFISIIEYNIIP